MKINLDSEKHKSFNGRNTVKIQVSKVFRYEFDILWVLYVIPLLIDMSENKHNSLSVLYEKINWPVDSLLG